MEREKERDSRRDKAGHIERARKEERKMERQKGIEAERERQQEEVLTVP